MDIKIYGLWDYYDFGPSVFLRALPRPQKNIRPSFGNNTLCIRDYYDFGQSVVLVGADAPTKTTFCPHLKKYIIYKGLERLRAIGRFGGR